VAGISWQWWRADARAVEAMTARRESEQRSLEVVQRNYFNQIARAQQAWLSNRPLEAERLLQDCRNATPELCDWEWDYLTRLCQPPGLTFTGHDREVRGCVVTPDGRRLITGGGFFLGTPPGGQIIIWDTATGKALHQIDDASLGIQDLALSPDGKQLAAACASGEVKVWLLERLQLPPKIMPNEAINIPHAIAFSPDGKRLAAACMKSNTQVWDLESNQVRRLLIHRGNASGVAWSPDGRWLATTGRDHIVHLLDANTLAETRKFDAYANATCLRFSPDSRRLAVGNYRGQVFVWDLGAGTDSKWTYAADQSYIRSLHFTPDGLHLGICFHGGPARLVNLASSATTAEFRGHERGVMRMEFSSGGRYVYTAGIDGKVRKWDLASRREPYEFYAHPGFIYEIAFSPDGRYLLIPGGHNPTLRGIIDQQTLVKRRLDGSEPQLVCKGHKGWLTCAAYRPDGLQMASGAEDKTIILWNAQTGKPQHTLGDHPDAVTSIAYGLAGKVLVSGCADGSVRFWDVETGSLLHTRAEHKGGVIAVDCSRTLPVAASTGADHVVCIWDLQSGRCLHQFENPEGMAATGATFSHGGNLLACAFANWTIQLFDVDSRGNLQERGTPMRLAVRFSEDEGRETPIPSRPQRVGLSFSKDDRRLVSTAPKCPVQMWDVSSFQEALVLPHANTYFLSAMFSPDGKRLAASFSDSVSIWDTQSRTDDRTATPAIDARTNRDWHASQSEIAADGENWFGLLFHERSLISLDPGSTLRWSRLATAYLASGDAAKHREACAQMLKLCESNQDPRAATNTAYVCVVDLQGGGNPRQLVDVSASAAKAFPGALRVHAAALYRAGEFAKALAQFEAAASRFRRRAWDWLFLAMIHHRLGEEKKASDYYEQALENMRGINPYFDWKERVEVQTLHNEAKALLHPVDKP
jgi:WD40 repeat protein